MIAYRATARTGGELVSVAVSSTLGGPYIDERKRPAVLHAGEDPYIWRDERSHWHVLIHNMGGGVGAHAFRRDAVDWTRSGDEPYSSTVERAPIGCRSQKEKSHTGSRILLFRGVVD
jgi:hypothetical protein